MFFAYQLKIWWPDARRVVEPDQSNVNQETKKCLSEDLKMKKFLTTTFCAILAGGAALAQDVNLTPDQYSAEIELNGESITIERNQDQDAVIDAGFAKTSRACPPFCIHPMSAGEGVETYGEMELISFLKDYVSTGEGLLLDSRIPSWFAKGTIPGAINLPFTALSAENKYRDEILGALGGKQEGETWDLSEAKELLLFCNGPWCDQSPRAIQDLLAVGYPASKLRYYRGGMQMWHLLGLNVVVAEEGAGS